MKEDIRAGIDRLLLESTCDDILRDLALYGKIKITDNGKPVAYLASTGYFGEFVLLSPGGKVIAYSSKQAKKDWEQRGGGYFGELLQSIIKMPVKDLAPLADEYPEEVEKFLFLVSPKA